MTALTHQPIDKTMRELNQRIRNFTKSQEKVAQRVNDIRRGNLTHQRTPTRTLVAIRDRNRNIVRQFLTTLTQDDKECVAITLSTRHWEDQLLEQIMESNDPAI